MIEKSETLAVCKIVDGQLHVLGIVDPFVSSRLGSDVSCETEREHDAEHSVVAAAISDLEGSQA